MKLSYKIEKKIENLIDAKTIRHLTEPKSLGRVKRLEDGNEKYIKILKKNFPQNFNLKNMRIVLDCANGAGYKSAPKILSDLGAKVYSIGVKPDGLNINNNCGSTYPEVLKRYVKKFKANLGIALDGDADRVIMCDEKGQIIDGDQIIAMIARRWKRKKILKGGVIGTLMSNYGLENFFSNVKINFKRANVGDRYVKEMMKKYNFNLGGEQSGHIILGKFATTGDGLLVALETLFALRKGKLASEALNVYKSVPQRLLNIKVKNKNIIYSQKCKNAIKRAEKLIKNKGRLLVRPSGTEPKVRIMCESFNLVLMKKCVNIIKKTIHKK
jgi:phosphoglucosamine mutase